MRQRYSRKSQFHVERRRLSWSLCAVGIAMGLTSLVVFTADNSTPNVDCAPRLARAFAIWHHTTDPGPVPPLPFTDAPVASEDQRFFSVIDVGVDPIALIHLVMGTSGLGSARHGGASIDQQLAKLLYTPNQSGSVVVDIEQVILAVKLHLSYSRRDVLRMMPRWPSSGMAMTDWPPPLREFGRLESQLTPLQAAMLAGLVNAPTADNPRRHLAQAMQRCQHVVLRLVALHDLTRQQAATLLAQPLGLVKKTAR